DLGDGRTVAFRVEPGDLRVRQQRNVRMLESRPHPEHLGVRLGMDEAREAVTGSAPDTGADRHVRLVEHDSAGRVEGPEAGGREVVGELLDPWLARGGGGRGRWSG